MHYCRNTEPPHNGDEDPEPERTIRQKKQGDINRMEEKWGKNGMYAQLQDPKSTAVGLWLRSRGPVILHQSQIRQ